MHYCTWCRTEVLTATECHEARVLVMDAMREQEAKDLEGETPPIWWVGILGAALLLVLAICALIERAVR